MHDDEGLCLPYDDVALDEPFCEISEGESDGCIVPTADHCDPEKEVGNADDLSEGDILLIDALYKVEDFIL